ncbi:MAG TPA: SCO5389 family protein [Pseudonocardia sp.]
MSLTVPDSLLEQARRGPVEDAEFVACIRDSLPYAWSVVEMLAAELRESDRRSVQSTSVPPDEQAWGQLFRMVGSDAMRAAVQRHFGVRMAFQNCCKVGLFESGADAEFDAFTSPRAQILNQNPTLLNC